MTEREDLMYKIISKISETNAPIVFKGALITKLILEENNYTEIQRATKDIDANWIDNPPSMSILRDTIYRALGDMQNNFDVDISRTYEMGKSAGLSIKDKATGDKIISIDIDIKPSVGNRTYYLGEACVKGVLADEILADKICTVSSDLIYKYRAKDMIDVYSLAHCVKVNTADIFFICEKAGRTMQDFNAFFERKNDIEHAYNMLKNVIGKPDFSKVYDYLKKFLDPFISKDYTREWNPNAAEWGKIYKLNINIKYIEVDKLNKLNKVRCDFLSGKSDKITYSKAFFEFLNELKSKEQLSEAVDVSKKCLLVCSEKEKAVFQWEVTKIEKHIENNFPDKQTFDEITRATHEQYIKMQSEKSTAEKETITDRSKLER